MIYPELWEKLEAMDFSSADAGKTFAKRMMAEQGWSQEFVDRAILEYKRFAYLNVISSEELVPSDVVDQVWRHHLSYTRHYWGEFCAVLGKNLHHEAFFPDKHEVALLNKRYLHTIRLYRDEFGREYDPAVWPEVGERFSKMEDYVRVDVTKSIVLQRPTEALWRSVGRFAAVALFPLCVTGYAVSQSSLSTGGILTSSDWIVVAGIAIVIATFGCLVWQMEFKTNKIPDPVPQKALRKRMAKAISRPVSSSKA